MVVWEGGSTKGGRYDPATDSWTPTASIPARPRSSHVAQWTGNLMLVWGGVDPGGFRTDTGDRYDPLTDSWSPISQLLAPSARSGATSVWTGDRMIVWGASEDNQDWDTGALY